MKLVIFKKILRGAKKGTCTPFVVRDMKHFNENNCILLFKQDKMFVLDFGLPRCMSKKTKYYCLRFRMGQIVISFSTHDHFFIRISVFKLQHLYYSYILCISEFGKYSRFPR